MEKEYKMSQSRADELQEELNYLKTTRSDEVAEQIKVARGFGDLSENSEYDEAKNEQGKVTVKGPAGDAAYTIVGSQESDPMHGVISEESPFGKGLIGAREGDTVSVEAPQGVISYTVLKIER